MRQRSHPIPPLMPTARAALAAACVLLFLSLLGACSPKPAPLSPLPGDAIILAFGDSLTAGTGAEESRSYPRQLAALSGRKVINAGLPGEVSSDGLARLPALLDEHQPHLLILTHGGNDLLRRMDVEQTRDNLAAMIRLARDRGTEVLLVAVPAPTLLRLRSDAIYAEIGQAFRIPVENGALARILARDAMKSDPIHPNADGYRYLAEHIHRLLIETGAL
jgi:acyl-CoA thioesterase I